MSWKFLKYETTLAVKVAWTCFCTGTSTTLSSYSIWGTSTTWPSCFSWFHWHWRIRNALIDTAPSMQHGWPKKNSQSCVQCSFGTSHYTAILDCFLLHFLLVAKKNLQTSLIGVPLGSKKILAGWCLLYLLDHWHMHMGLDWHLNYLPGTQGDKHDQQMVLEVLTNGVLPSKAASHWIPWRFMFRSFEIGRIDIYIYISYIIWY